MTELTALTLADALEWFRVLFQLLLLGASVFVLLEISLLLAFGISLWSDGRRAGRQC
jgi:predicted membrane-bound dolichyl-phosphate-mannose-protein mannosyltransferase